MGDASRTAAAVHRLRLRWLAPSPPLAVDDEPLWHPEPESEGDAGAQDDLDGPALVSSAS